MPEPAAQHYEPEWVTKTEMARRQLCAAIRMFFERRDPIVVQTLAAAAHQILTHVGVLKGVDGVLKGRRRSSAEQVRQLNYAANFFKHADNDPDARINVEPLGELTAEFLMDAVSLLQCIAGVLPIEAKMFWSWVVTKHRDLFEDAGPAISGLIDAGLDPDDYDAMLAMLTLHDLMPSDSV
jgi:hypothetical protein